MAQTRSILVALALAFLAGACSKHEPRSERAGEPGPAAELAIAPPDEADPGGRVAVPSFRSDILPVLATNCAGARGCHGEEPTDKVELDLRADNAYEDLVGRAAKSRPNAVRVVPRDPGASFLIAKLVAHLSESEGKTMPIDPRTGETVPMTPPVAEFVERSLRPWIAAGAPNN